MKKKGLFLTHPHALNSEITGGVQLCSQEFHHLISSIDELSIENYFVPYTKNIFQRLLMKLGLENYSMYDIKKDVSGLIMYIENQDIEIVFVNMASLVRYARPIREKFGDRVKLVLLSHGNHSGDFLHLITKPVVPPSFIRAFLNRLRLGFLIATEANHRVKYLNAVVALSETEMQIENWFGAPKAYFLPRRLHSDFVAHKPIIGRIGFVGRLDHPPNYQGMQILLDEFQKTEHNKLEIRIVGAPVAFGQKLKTQYPFINYLGELSNELLEEEISTWAFLLNPVWWYSTGASTKLGKAISWGIPIISTTAGVRGYHWTRGKLLIADSPQKMAELLIENANNIEQIRYWTEQTREIAQNGPCDIELLQIIKNSYN